MSIAQGEARVTPQGHFRSLDRSSCRISLCDMNWRLSLPLLRSLRMRGLLLLVPLLLVAEVAADERGHPKDDELQAFVDATLEQTMQEHNARGAVVSVVRNGELVVSTGRGYSFFDEDQVVDPEETVFRIGSVAKVITYLAAMQRIDRGAIDPDEDITRYLRSVGVDDTYDAPVTLEHLATHTAGFGAGAVGITNNPDHLRPRTEVLENPRALRIRPPGDLPGYGNYATELTAQLISDESGQDFEAYVRENIFEPIGMTSSMFEQHPEALHRAATNEAQRVDMYSQMPAAGGMRSTASDMGRLMLALLTDGATDDGRVLSAEAASSMLARWFTPHEALEGVAFGFWRQRRGNEVMLFHGGGIGSFRSQLLLVPAMDLGLFVSYHGGPGGGGPAFFGQRDFVEAFLDEFVPVQAPELPSEGGADPQHSGTYISLDLLHADRFDKLLFMGDQPPLNVDVDEEGFLLTEGGENRWFQVEPEVYHRADGKEALAFREADSKRYFFRGSAPVRTYKQVGFWQQPVLHGWALLISLFVLLSGVIGWSVAAGWRWYRDVTSDVSPLLYRARWVAGGAFGLLLLFVGALVGLAVSGAIFQPPSWLPALGVFNVLAVMLTLLATWYAGRAWLLRAGSLFTRLHFSAIVLALWCLAWLLHYWNLLVPSFG